MRLVREVTAEEESFRLELVEGLQVIRRDPVEPEPVGTIVLVAMRVIGYDPDCDGSLMARLEQLSLDELDSPIDPELLAADKRAVASYSKVTVNRGLYPTTGFVATPAEIRALYPSASPVPEPRED